MFSTFSLRQSGFTLLEVLISIFVVLVGLLGVASMIPAGRFELTEARKADMGSNISRALLQSVVAQTNKEKMGSNKHFYVVPTDYAKIASMLQGFSSLTGITFKNDYLLNGDDDLLTSQDENQKTLLFGKSNWSNAGGFDQTTATGTGDYAGFATLVSLSNGFYEVSAAVNYRSKDVTDTSVYGNLTLSEYNSLSGNGKINSTDVSVNLKRGQFVLLNRGDEWHWMKVDFIADDGSATYITLSGPSWRDSGNPVTKIYVLGDVVSVSSRVVRLGE